MTDNATIAAQLAAQGVYVFPCYAADCNADKAKRPLRGFRWRSQATRNPDLARRIWTQYPQAMPGINMGMSGFVGIDCDVKSKANGVAAFEGLCAMHGFTPPEYVETPTGGRHYYFRAPAGLDLGNRTGALPKGIDVRGDGGFLIAPGAHLVSSDACPNGGDYTDLDLSDPPDMPQWLIDIILAEPEDKRETERAAAPVPVPAIGHAELRIEAYAQKAFDDEMAKLAGTAEGGRNNALNEAAFSLGTMIGAGWLPENLVTSVLLNTALNIGLARSEAVATIKSGLEAGKRKPRPPLSEDGGIVIDFARVQRGADIRNALLNAPLPAGEQEAGADAPPAEFDGEFSISRPPAIIRKLLPAGGLVIDGGQSGAGKSYAEVDQIVAIASGQDWFGEPVRRRVGVAYVPAEGGATIGPRIIAAKEHRGIADKVRLPLAVTKWPSINLRDLRQFMMVQRGLEAIGLRFMAEHGVPLGVVILDTISASCWMKDENNNAEIAQVCAVLRSLADSLGVVLIGVHHFGKSQDTGLRGGSAWRANCDHSRIFLADREAVGAPAFNRRMVLEKNRLGPEGEAFGFELVAQEYGRDEWGDPITECHIEPCAFDQRKSKARREPESVRKFREAFVAVAGTYVAPAGTSRPHLTAVPLADVREAFNRSWATAEEKLSAREADAQRKAWKRAEAAVRGVTFAMEIIGGIEWVWPI